MSHQTELNPQYIDHMGSDMRAVNMARQSFGKRKDESQPLDAKDKGLIRFLAEGIRSCDKADLLDQMTQCADPEEMIGLAKKLFPQKHWVPLAHNMISISMEAPVPIRTQCFKHKIGFVESEESRRYISDEPVVFLPKQFNAAPSKDIKQGSAGIHHRNDYWLKRYKRHTDNAVNTYIEMVADGIAPEDARFVLPQGTIVNWGWTGSLFGFASFYNQRSDAHAQSHIQDLAQKVSDIISPLYPTAWEALTGVKAK